MLRSLIFLFFSGLLLTACTEKKPADNPIRNPQAAKTAMMEEPPKSNRPVVDSSITIDYLMGKFSPERHPDFTKISTEYANAEGLYLRKEVMEAFEKMSEAASANGIKLQIISATRPFAHQKRIWEAKWNGSRKVGGQDLSKTIADPAERAIKILTYSSMPGTSRHHWGTDFDLNSLEPAYFNSGKGKAIYDWLAANAADYGFCQPYSERSDSRPFGYEEEKWHWSYVPVSKKLTDQYILRIKDADISGFKGSEVAGQINMIEKWVYGINSSCK